MLAFAPSFESCTNTFQTFTTAVGDCDEARDFHQSELAQPEWSHIWPDPVSCYEGVRHNAAEMHVVMFKVLHDPRSAVKDIEEMALNEIVCLCALSEYYGCFVHISSKVSYAISMSSSFDQDIEDMPTAFLRLAVKLEDESLYVKAYRLIVARSLRDKRTVHSWVYSDTRLLANHLGLSQEQYVDKYSKIIMTPLRKLQLRKAVSQHKDEDHTVRTSWVSMLKKAWSGRAADEKSFETSSFLARSLFSEWLTAEDFSEDIRLEEMDFPRQCSTEPGWPNFIIAKIEKFSQAEYPGELIGKGVVAEAVAAFGGGWASNAVEQVYAGVGRLVLEANWEIQKALALQPDFSTNKILTPCRCIQAINGDDTYSHLGGPEFDLPWEWENREDFWDRVL